MNKIIFTVTLIILSISFVKADVSSAKAVDEGCKNVEVIFSRGSGQPLNDGEAKQYFKEINDRISKSTASVTTYELGAEEYGGHKYQAIQVNKFPWNTAIGAKVSSGYANNYGKSVDSGVGELYSYLTQRYEKCKKSNTQYVLAGYSQGAQVIGQTLPKFTSELRKNIIYAAFFGDPKLHLPEGEGPWGLAPACWGNNLSAYRKQIANCNVDNGSLGARKPYLPEDMKNKSGLWCYDHDYVCGVTHNIFDNEGHSKYKDKGRAIDQAAQIIASKLKVVLPKIPPLSPSLPPIDGSLIDDAHFSGHGTTGKNTVFLVDLHPSMESRLPSIKEFIKKTGRKIMDEGGQFTLGIYTSRPTEFDPQTQQPIKTETLTAAAQFEGAMPYILDGDGLDIVRPLDSQGTTGSSLKAMYDAAQQISWEKGATKSMILFTNNAPHGQDPDGVTQKDVADLMLRIDPVNVFPVVPENISNEYGELAKMTSGRVIKDTGNLETEAEEIMKRVDNRPIVLLKNSEYIASTKQEITFDASDSYVIDSEIVKYEWDFNGDGIFEKTTTTPVAKHTYAQAGDGIIQVRATAKNGSLGNGSATLKIGTYTPPDLPPAPKDVKSQVLSTVENKSTVKVQWKPGDDITNQWEVKVNGIVLGVTEPDRTEVEITDIDRTVDTAIGIAAVSADGIVSETSTVIIAKVPTTTTAPNWWQTLIDSINKSIQTLLSRIWLGNL